VEEFVEMTTSVKFLRSNDNIRRKIIEQIFKNQYFDAMCYTLYTRTTKDFVYNIRLINTESYHKIIIVFKVI